MRSQRRSAPQAVTFPRMGTGTIVFRSILEDLGVHVITPPQVGANTVELGVRHSPECACFPLKLNIGNYLEAAKLGAQAVLMVGGVGPCRLGYYAEVQRAILRDMGLELDMVVLEPPTRGWGQLGREIARLTGGRSWLDLAKAFRLGWAKLGYLDELEALAQHLRPREEQRGEVEAALSRAIRWLDETMTLSRVAEAGRAGIEGLVRVNCRDDVDPLRIGVIGEIFMVLEPSVNQSCVRTLGELGAEVEQTIWLSGWVHNNLAIGPWRARGDKSETYYRRIASPYLGHSVGGEGQQNVGHAIHLARRGFDGIVHLAPFTCMPEIVARTALDAVSRDYGIPVLTFFLDEHSGEAGMHTRLEAFVDLLGRRRHGLGVAVGAAGTAVSGSAEQGLG